MVIFDETGRPSFNILQNYGSAKAQILYFAFDVLVLTGRDIMSELLHMRRELLEIKVMPKLPEPVRFSPELSGSVAESTSPCRPSQSRAPFGLNYLK